MDYLLRSLLSNVCLSAVLALAATLVGTRLRRPHLAHLLWLLVLLKLLTPPVLSIPIDLPPLRGSSAGGQDAERGVVPRPGRSMSAFSTWESVDDHAAATDWKPWMAAVWLLGSGTYFVWSLHRVRRFARLLKDNTRHASSDLQSTAQAIARSLDLKAVPEILSTSAHLVPMVWWAGGKIQVVLPDILLCQLDTIQSRWILAHELAHVRRRDYLVRWLEWLACGWFWWNPVVWWGQRQLRQAEEVCCDSLVLSSLKPDPCVYADSLLRAVELLAFPAIRPPAMASEVNSGGFLEWRVRMIVSKATTRINSRWSKVCILVGALLVLPLGFVRAEDIDAVAGRLKAAVQAGELTGPQAEVMLHALKKTVAAEQASVKKKLEPDFEAINDKIEAAVQAGVLTKEQAKAKWAVIKQQAQKELGVAKEATELSDEAIGQIVEEAVRVGLLSKEEAKQRWAAMKEQRQTNGK